MTRVRAEGLGDRGRDAAGGMEDPSVPDVGRRKMRVEAGRGRPEVTEGIPARRVVAHGGLQQPRFRPRLATVAPVASMPSVPESALVLVVQAVGASNSTSLGRPMPCVTETAHPSDVSMPSMHQVMPALVQSGTHGIGLAGQRPGARRLGDQRAGWSATDRPTDNGVKARNASRSTRVPSHESQQVWGPARSAGPRHSALIGPGWDRGSRPRRCER
jgi:hypothetical protein